MITLHARLFRLLSVLGHIIILHSPFSILHSLHSQFLNSHFLNFSFSHFLNFSFSHFLILSILSFSPFLLSCGDVENSIYQGHRCYFVFDTTLHPQPCQLTTVLGNPGQFVTVSSSMVSGVRHIQTVRNYDQAREDVPLTTKPETQTACLLGAGNAIIVGRSSYTGLLMAYEGQCPNCLSAYGGTSYPLTWTASGLQLRCARCQRCYDVNNGVVAQGDGGHQLYIYNAAFDGALLRAWN